MVVMFEISSFFEFQLSAYSFFFLFFQIDNRAVAQLLESIVFVIDSVLPLRRPPQGVIEELEQDLKHMIYRHSFLTVVHSCIRYMPYFAFLCFLSGITDILVAA